MITVTLDATAITKQVGTRADEVLQRAVDVLGEFALDRIRSLSSEHLSIETWEEFAKSLQVKREQDSITIGITDERMKSLEEGYQGFDIKPGLLRSPKAKKGANGKYIDVPFQHKTTKRGAGQYVESASMRASINKAMQKAKSTGRTQRIAKAAEVSAKLAGIRVSAEKGATTFRRVSEATKNTAWMHPGLEGVHAFAKTANEIDDIKEQVIADIIKEMT